MTMTTEAASAGWDAPRALIEGAWEGRAALSPLAAPEDLRRAVALVMDALDDGRLRAAEPRGGAWCVNGWVKQAILLSFRLGDNQLISGGPSAGSLDSAWYDKVPLKFAGWSAEQFRQAGLRAVPGSIVRRSAYIAPQVVLMPCFVNVGAHVGAGTMIDTWATVGSCAQVGQRCHISGGAGIGGVLEPLQAAPVIIEDDVFIGARSEVAEGVQVEQGAVLAMGVFLGASTIIIDRQSGERTVGRVPAYSVVVPGTLPGRPLPDGSPGPSLACAVIVKRVDARTRAKTSPNELLRG